ATAKHGRFRAALENAFMAASHQAQAVTDASLRTGRPVDAYGLAGVAGAGAGGGFAGAVNPAVPEAAMREMRMRELQGLIGQHLQFEHEMAAIESARAEARLRNADAGYVETQKPLDAAAKRGDRL